MQGDAFHLESINYVEKESIEVRIRNSTSTEIKPYEAIPAVFFPLQRINNMIKRTSGKIRPIPIPTRILFIRILCDITYNTRSNAASQIAGHGEQCKHCGSTGRHFLDVILIVPGHMIPTEKPHTIQPVNPITGFDDKVVKR